MIGRESTARTGDWQPKTAVPFLSKGTARLCEQLEESFGDVPWVRLSRALPQLAAVKAYMKLESCNPGGSIKEKNAAYLINMAERDGKLQPGGTIIESSSGNFGVGLAMLGARRDYRVIIVIDAKTTFTFRRMLAAYGAETVELSAADLDRHGSMQRARIAKATQLAAEIPGAWYPCQHFNPDNPNAHAEMTALEVERAFGSRLDALVVGVSTGGQLSGLARYLKPRYPDLCLVGVDVKGSVIFADEATPYKMTGVGLSFRPPNLDYRAIDRAYVVPEEVAYSACHAMSQREGLLLGSSTGAILAATGHLARTLKPEATVAMINPDRGDRYLDTIYNPVWLEENGFEILSGNALELSIDKLRAASFILED